MLVGFVPLGLVSILLSLALVPVAFSRTPEPTVPNLSIACLYAISPLGVAQPLPHFGVGHVAQADGDGGRVDGDVEG